MKRNTNQQYSGVNKFYFETFKIMHINIQGTPHIPTGFCRPFAALICMLPKIAINIFFALVSELSTIQISTSYHENCSNAITECNTGQISRARQTPIMHILLKKTLTHLITYRDPTLGLSPAQIC